MVLGLEAMFIFLECADMVLDWFFLIKSSKKKNVLRGKHTKTVLIVRSVILFLIFVDWLITIFGHWRWIKKTDNKTTGKNSIGLGKNINKPQPEPANNHKPQKKQKKNWIDKFVGLIFLNSVQK